MICSPTPQRGESRIGRVEGFSIPIRLLQVVAEDLVDLDKAAMLLEPGGEALVELGPGFFRQRVVCGVSDEQVTKAKGIVIRKCGRLRTDHVLPDEGLQAAGYSVASGFWCKLLDDAT